MTSKPTIKDIKVAKKELDKEMIKGLLEYVRNGVFPNNSPNSYMNAYTIVHSMADQGDEQSSELFKYHNDTIQGFVDDCYKIISKESSNQLIDKFISVTENINFLIYWMNRIFTYLDRFYTKAKSKQTLCQNAMNSYKEHLFDKIQNNIYIEVNKLIKEDRNCNIESRPKIKTILKILYDIDLSSPKIIREKNKISWVQDIQGNENRNETAYQDKWFEDYFKAETTKFAKDKANADIHNMSAPEYIMSQLKYLEDEEVRQGEYINPKYKQKINDINYRLLIGENAQELSKMDTGIPYMFNTKRNEELKKTFQLFKLYPASLEVITDAFQPYIKRRGEEIHQNKEITKDPKKFIPELISLKKEMDNLVLECFENHTQFQDKKNKAFSNFMNKEIYSKQLSNYTDFCMRNGFKGKSAEEIENTLNDIIGLFKCLNSKLVFQLDCNKKMSERLIKNVSLSIKIEKDFISKLRQEVGVIFVNKMMEMINDLEKNKKELDSYKASASKGAPNGIKFNIQVISQSAWEINKKSMEKIEMPKFMASCLEDFENFYLRKHSMQKLIWCLGLSKLDVQFLYLKNKNIALTTLPQILTLLQLETYGTITIAKVAELLGCNVNTVITDLHGLVFNPTYNPQGQAEKGVIIGSFNAQSKEFKESDTISINKNFTVARQKFHTLPLAVKKSAAEVRENELEEAQITKRYQDNILQATLTRIMKSRIGQTTTHVWLINEASKQIDLFKAQPQQIKENIEKLIEKNIIKRSDKNKSCYDYIA
jgi:cullin 3